MLALRLVVDTNILVSAALNPEGLQRAALIVALTKPARIYVTQPVLIEYAAVLARRELKIRKGERLRLLQLIYNRSALVRPRRS
ncbi:MAG: PIN domain-containing protein, partial [Terracidiphilus sp.]